MDSLKLLTFAEHKFECKQALLFALQRESSWKGGGGGGGDVHLTDIPAVSDTLRTDGGCHIWTKLGLGGQYITLR